jgi:hypothetical protein
MIWFGLLIMFCGFWGALVGLGEVLVALLWIVQNALVDLFGQRIGGALALVVICALLGLGAYYMSTPSATAGEDPAHARRETGTPSRTSEARARSDHSRRVGTRCGLGPPPGAVEPESWSEYRCELRRDTVCLGWRAYTDMPTHGCPGAALCCAPEK